MNTNFVVKDTTYNLHLGAKACVELEKKLGTNPVNVLVAIGEGQQLPKLDTMLTILHASMTQFNHGITMDKVYDIYDQFTEDGKTLIDLVPIIIEVFQNSGLIPKEGN